MNTVSKYIEKHLPVAMIVYTRKKTIEYREEAISHLTLVS